MSGEGGGKLSNLLLENRSTELTNETLLAAVGAVVVVWLSPFGPLWVSCDGGRVPKLCGTGLVCATVAKVEGEGVGMRDEREPFGTQLYSGCCPGNVCSCCCPGSCIWTNSCSMSRPWSSSLCL